MRKKGPTRVKIQGIDPQKKFSSANIKKVPTAYESLNPALGGLRVAIHFWVAGSLALPKLQQCLTLAHGI
jgi:hypothetical protein